MATLTFHAPLLRAIADRMALPPIAESARAAGIIGVYRFSVHYFDGRAHDSVATLRHVSTGAWIEVHYDHQPQKPVITPIPLDRYQLLVKAFVRLQFDKMSDQDNLSSYDSTDLWLVERAAGTFVHSVILAPALATGVHNGLANAVRHALPEALEMVK